MHTTQGAALEAGQGAIMGGRGQEGEHPEKGEEEVEAAATQAEELVICAKVLKEQVQKVWAGNC